MLENSNFGISMLVLVFISIKTNSKSICVIEPVLKDGGRRLKLREEGMM